MADRFYSDIEVPEYPTTPAPAMAGFVKIYGRAGRIYGLDSSGNEYDLTQGGGSSGDLNLDGGFANAVYLPTQNVDGGDANG